jgi:DNA-directed RNA polymerase sigma subunit (sigma70/sigma32)
MGSRLSKATKQVISSLSAKEKRTIEKRFGRSMPDAKNDILVADIINIKNNRKENK